MRCFVIMGYGRKTDLATGRVLDLDRTYKYIIKPAVLGAGLECVRADEIRHSGVIDVPMYDQLLAADVVVADISTANPNAIYELGIRHALKPRTTVVISESQLKYPFDLNHISIMSYVHHGEIIDVEEATKFSTELTTQLKAVIAGARADSPVYTYIPGLVPPGVPAQKVAADIGAGNGSAKAIGMETLSAVRERGENAITKDDWAGAEAAFLAMQTLLDPADPNGVYVTQRLTLATYKGKKPTHREALQRARSLLEPLSPRTSNDPETLGLAGAIEKRLFDETADAQHLDAAVRCYERGFYIRHDYYNGINFAFMLDVRAAVNTTAADERLADRVVARRARREVLVLCKEALASLDQKQPVNDDEKRWHREQRYWLLATVAEAWFGLGQPAEGQAAFDEALSYADKPFMRQSTEAQLEKLRALLAA